MIMSLKMEIAQSISFTVLPRLTPSLTFFSAYSGGATWEGLEVFGDRKERKPPQRGPAAFGHRATS